MSKFRDGFDAAVEKMTINKVAQDYDAKIRELAHQKALERADKIQNSDAFQSTIKLLNNIMEEGTNKLLGFKEKDKDENDDMIKGSMKCARIVLNYFNGCINIGKIVEKEE